MKISRLHILVPCAKQFHRNRNDPIREIQRFPNLAGVADSNSSKLISVCEIFGLSQLITEPTRVTALSQSLIDLCITNTPDKIVTSGVMPLGISDHSLVYLIRKTHYTIPGCNKIISTRSFKNFNQEEFLADLEFIQWDDISLFPHPNEMREFWKNRQSCKV